MNQKESPPPIPAEPPRLHPDDLRAITGAIETGAKLVACAIMKTTPLSDAHCCGQNEDWAKATWGFLKELKS